jgi:hypothetical protein
LKKNKRLGEGAKTIAEKRDVHKKELEEKEAKKKESETKSTTFAALYEKGSRID